MVLPTMDWDELAWLRSVCPIPLIAKGILRADDAVRAVEAGCDGIWVSNHGGRQLDTSIASADALPEVAEAVGGRALLVVDGGVRRGIDVLKALALGADLVAVGRPVLWGLAVDGADGVHHVLEILRDELSLAMALAGCRRLDEITPDLWSEAGAEVGRTHDRRFTKPMIFWLTTSSRCCLDFAPGSRSASCRC